MYKPDTFFLVRIVPFGFVGLICTIHCHLKYILYKNIMCLGNVAYCHKYKDMDCLKINEIFYKRKTFLLLGLC